MITDEQRTHNTYPGGVPTLHQPLPPHIYKSRYYNKEVRGIPTAPIDATPIYNHIEHHINLGMNECMIAAAAGCSNSTISLIRDRKHPRVKRATAARILTVSHHPHPRQKLCLAIGATRRIHALQALGWPLTTLAQHLNTTPANVHRSTTEQQIQYKHWRNIHDLYNQLSATRGPSQLAADRALNTHKAPPLAWYGIDIDHPHATPNTGNRKKGKR